MTRKVFLLFMAISLLAVRPVNAENDQAMALYRAGIALFKAKAPGQALKLLIRSRAMKETPDVVWAIARCYEMQGKYKQAIENLSRFMLIAPDKGAQDYARGKFVELKKKLGHLHLESNLKDSKVFIDKKPAGQTPLVTDIDPGVHEIRIEKKGWQKVVKRIKVAEGEKRELLITLNPVQVKPRHPAKPRRVAKPLVKRKPFKPVAAKTVATGVAPPKTPFRKMNTLNSALLWGGLDGAWVGLVSALWLKLLAHMNRLPSDLLLLEGQHFSGMLTKR
jgi:hypothetical protein